MTITDRSNARRTPSGRVRTCDICGRPLTARDKSEYTAARAKLVADNGLCVCPGQAPARGPSLI